MKGPLHQIQFTRGLSLDARDLKTERSHVVQVSRGSCLHAQVVPYQKGSREVADLYFSDGSVAREISFAYFQFSEAA